MSSLHKKTDKKSSKKSLWRKILIGIGLLLVIPLVAVIGFAIYLGYYIYRQEPCNSWHDTITREERIYHAVRIINGAMATRFKYERDGEIFYGLGKPKHYKNAEEILRLYPNCCELYTMYYDSIEDPTPVSADNPRGVVHVEYPGHPLEHRGELTPGLISSYVSYNSCK